MTDDELLALKRVTPKDAAKYLGCAALYVSRGLQEGVLPFGSAVYTGKEWAYDIRPLALIEYNRYGKRDHLDRTVKFILDAVNRLMTLREDSM